MPDRGTGLALHVGLVAADVLDRRAVPGLHAHLVLTGAEPLRHEAVGHDVAGAGQRLVVLPAALADDRGRHAVAEPQLARARRDERAVPDDPDVLALIAAP